MTDLAVLPTEEEMFEALLTRNAEYEGIFYVAVRTTGVFCRPTCPARKPQRQNVSFYRNASDALAAGYRPCRRCRPLSVYGEMPAWIQQILDEVEADPSERWTDARLRHRSASPERLRRWFQQHHGMTFQAYLRARRLSQALRQVSVGDSVTHAALDSGFQSLSGFRDAFQRWCGETPLRANADRPPLIVNRIPSPLGPLVAAAADEGAYLLEFADRKMLETQCQRLVRWTGRTLAVGDHTRIDQLARELGEYFAGRRERFQTPWHAPGTDFQRAVWQGLAQIPYGSTISYEHLARDIGHPTASRAVGRANGDNRLAILIPCHRVIRRDGSLCGYGGGLRRKQWLLELEGAI